jgi:flagellar biosynthesis protein FlhF
MAQIFSAVGAGELLPTRIDIARRLGGILSAAHHGTMSFSDYSNTPKVAQGLSPMTPKALARFLMPGAYRKQEIPNMRKNMPKAAPSKVGMTQ